MRQSLTCLVQAVISCLVILGWSPPAWAEGPGKALVESGSKVAFLGDSITDQGWKHPAGYVKLIVRGLETARARVTPIPAGVGGNIAREMRDRLQKDVLDKKPDWLLLSCGINDVWHLRQHKEGFDDYKRNITGLVDRALEAKVKVVILTTTVIGEDLNEGHNQTLVRYNQFLRSLARKKRCVLADVDADFRTALRSTKRPLTTDGVHLNPHGDQVVASCVLKALGLTREQLDRLQESCRDIPNAWLLRANHDRGMGKMFLVQKQLTIRQYERLERLADEKKLSVLQLVAELHRDNIYSFIKPRGAIESYDAIFEKKLQTGLQPKLQAMFDEQINRLLRK